MYKGQLYARGGSAGGLVGGGGGGGGALELPSRQLAGLPTIGTNQYQQFDKLIGY